MKKVVPYFQLGQKVLGEVEETGATDHLIVAFQGDLIRVVNSSRKLFKKGDKLWLYVWSLSPLEFRLVEAKAHRFERTI